MKLFNSYCYVDINTVADSIASHPFIGDGRVLKSFTIISPDQIELTYRKNTNNKTYTVTPPNCTTEGFNNSYFGLNISDSVEVSWMVATVMILAWSIKNLRRAK